MSEFDFEMRAGDDHQLVVTWTPDGEDADLADAEAEMVISWDALGSVSFTSEEGHIVFDDEADTVTVNMGHARTALIPPGDCFYQLRVATNDGSHTTIAAGTVLVKRDIIG
jgi:hypothetical protein